MRHVLIILAIVIMTGCTVQKTPEATGGSRSDGIIEMSYGQGLFEVPEVDWHSTGRRAAQRCKAWGYSEAESFGGSTSECTSSSAGTIYGPGSCNYWRVTMKYQCVGRVR